MNYQNKIKSLLKLLPHKLQVSYALACAESVFEYVRDEDKEVIRKSLNMTKLWLEDKATTDEVKAAYDVAYTAAYTVATSNAAHAAANAAHAASNAVYSAINIIYSAAYSSYSATYAINTSAYTHNKKMKDYYNLLIKIIKENMSTLDRILLNIDLTLEEV